MNNTLAAGFETPIVEIVAVVLILSSLGIGLVIFNVKREQRLQIRRVEASIARYDELATHRGLTRSDRNVLERLVEYLPRSIEPVSLLEQQGIFTRAAAMALNDAEVGPGQISALRVKLGFVGHPLGMLIRSSVDLPVGVSVALVLRHGAPRRGRVLQAEPMVLRVALEEGDARRFTDGRRVRVTHQNAAGVFSFDTAVLGREEDVIALQHSERVSVQQRRRFFRKTLEIPVSVAGVAPPRSRPVHAVFLDVGGGGASLTNPAGTFETGDWIDLSFGSDDRDPLTVSSTVVRTSRSGTVVHVEYRNPREATRDKIYRLLFSTETTEQERG